MSSRIATGEGTVHKARYMIQEWGLDEYEAQPGEGQ